MPDEYRKALMQIAKTQGVPGVDAGARELKAAKS